MKFRVQPFRLPLQAKSLNSELHLTDRRFSIDVTAAQYECVVRWLFPV
jgi:hypothetical protein